MGRPSLRRARRQEIARAFANVLAREGQSGATITAIANEAGVAPGLIHHHFADKDDLYDELLTFLVEQFRNRLSASDGGLAGYSDAAVSLGPGANVVAARAWVGLLAEALSTPTLHARVRRVLDREIEAIKRRSNFSDEDASAVLSFILGTLVFGSFAPRKVSGFAARSLHQFVAALLAKSP